MYIKYMQTLLISWVSVTVVSSFHRLANKVMNDTGQDDENNDTPMNIRDKIVEHLGMDKHPDTKHVRLLFIVHDIII